MIQDAINLEFAGCPRLWSIFEPYQFRDHHLMVDKLEDDENEESDYEG